MKTDYIEFRDLPGQNPLFLDALYDFKRVSDFYPCLPRDRNQILSRVDRILKSTGFPRHQLAETIRSVNEGTGAGLKCLENLEKLKSPDTVTVVSGQQVGLFGGPSFSVYKAITVIALCQYLESLGIQSVPIFWMATDDSDFDEVRSTYFVDSDDELLNFEVSDVRTRREQMAGTVTLEGIDAVVDQAASRIKVHPLGMEIGPLLGESYIPSRSFREAFAVWLREVFRDYGLVVFDPLMEDYREHLTDFYACALEKREQVLGAVLKRNEELSAAGYPVQVKTDATETFLFLIEGRHRYKLEFHNGYYQLKGRRGWKFTPERLRDALDKGTVLGPNVLLRPVLQDYLFPSAAAVAGPSEIAYYSQVNVVSPFWGREAAVFPRVGFTLLDAKVQRLLKKYRLTINGVLKRSSHDLAEKVLRSTDSGVVLREIDDMRDRLNSDLDTLKEKLEAEDPTVAAMVVNARKKMLFHVDKVQGRFVTNQSIKQVHLKHHLQYLQNNLLPNGVLQERVLNFNYFLAKFGPGIIRDLVDNAEPLRFGHRLVHV